VGNTTADTGTIEETKELSIKCQHCGEELRSTHGSIEGLILRAIRLDWVVEYGMVRTDGKPGAKTAGIPGKVTGLTCVGCRLER